MFFSRVVMREHPDPELVSALFAGGRYSAHQMLWRLFPDAPDAERDFLFREESGDGRPRFHLVSRRIPQGVEGLFRVNTKPYHPQLRTGQRLRFSLRANPVVTQKSGEDGKRQRHDVIMAAKKKIGKKPFDTQVLIIENGAKWLEDRAPNHGFAFDSSELRVNGYRQHRLSKPGKSGDIRYSTLDYDGIMTVTDPDRLVTALFEGIGRAKAFGCGLLLVRKV